MEAIEDTIKSLTDTFNIKMAEFQQDLHKASSTPTVTSLASDFNTFKMFVTNALSTIHKQVELLTLQQDQFEMRSRRKMLLLHGVSEGDDECVSDEVVKVVAERMKVSGFSGNDISRCQRLGHSRNDKARPILVKLRDTDMRNRIWFSKKSLKGCGITLSEFLTKTRHNVFLAARERFGVTKCWTQDGCVVIAGSGKARHRVFTLSDVDRLVSSFAPPAASSPAPAPMSSASNEGSKKISTAPPRSKRILKK